MGEFPARELWRHLRHGAFSRKVANRLRRSLGKAPLLLASPGNGDRNVSSRRINALLANRSGSPARYLEVGVQFGRTIEDVEAFERWAVDPEPKFNTARLPEGVVVFACISDSFFECLADGVVFDLVFLDGLHEYRQTYRDIVNASRVLDRSGVLLIDDVIPANCDAGIPDQIEAYERQRRAGRRRLYWQGDVYKAIRILADHHPDAEFRTIVGSGKEQTLVTLPRGPLGPVPSSVLREYEDLSFEECFGRGVPGWMHPVDERTAMHWVSVRQMER